MFGRTCQCEYSSCLSLPLFISTERSPNTIKPLAQTALLKCISKIGSKLNTNVFVFIKNK